MSKSGLRIGIADDEPEIRNSIVEILKPYQNYSFVEFRSADEIFNYLFDKIDAIDLDMLILDNDFKGGMTGIEALPELRELAPYLNIILLTAEERYHLIKEALPYKIVYINKPVSTTKLLIEIDNFSSSKSDNNFFLERIAELEADNREWQTLCDDTIPIEIKNIFDKIFPDVDFSPKAMLTICKNDKDDRLLRLIKLIDWKLPFAPGVNPQIYKCMKKQNVWEYRFSQKGRVYVQYDKDVKPVVVEIDYDYKWGR